MAASSPKLPHGLADLPTARTASTRKADELFEPIQRLATPQRVVEEFQRLTLREATRPAAGGTGVVASLMHVLLLPF